MKDTLDLKHSFENIKTLRSDILNIFNTIKAKSTTLNKVYEDMIKAHSKSEYMFGIDSFHFQNELIALDYDHMMNAFKKINNRMYCEYYQLYVLIRKYIESDITNDSLRSKILINKKFPVYKVLDINRVYRFTLVVELHDYITNTIVELESYRIAKDSELAKDTQQSKQGINIGNLVNSYRYSNALLNEKIKMFVRHLKVFHQHHKQYLTHLTIKTKLIIGIINEDITIKQLNPDGTSVVSDKKKHLTDEETIMNYVGNNIDESMNDELATIVSNISTSSDGSDEDTTRGLYNTSSNSTISGNKPAVSEPEPEPEAAPPVERAPEPASEHKQGPPQEAQPEPGSPQERQSEPEPDPQQETQPEPPQEAQPEPGPEPAHEPAHEPEPGPEPPQEAQPEPGPEPAHEPAHEPEPGPEPAHEPEPGPEPAHEPEPEPPHETQQEIEPEAATPHETQPEIEPEAATPHESEPIGDIAELPIDDETGNISDVTDDDMPSRCSFDDSVSNIDVQANSVENDDINSTENDDINSTENATPDDVINVLDQSSIKLTVTDISNNTAKIYPQCL